MKKINNYLKIVISVLFAVSVTMSPLLARALKFAHVYETSHPAHLAAMKAAELFKKRTKGKWEIKVFPASSLGGESEISEGLSLGTVDIAYVGAGFLGSVYPPISISSYPYILRNFNHWQAYVKSDLFKRIAKGYSEETGGNEILATVYFGTRQINSSKPIYRPSDMKGLKIRVPDAASYILFPKTLGANPTPIAYSEVYLALQQGVVEAVENPLPALHAKKFYELRKYISLTGHQINTLMTTVSSSTLKGMSKADKGILKKVLEESGDWATVETVKVEDELKNWFIKNGVNVNQVDRQPFIDAIAPELVKDGLPFTKKMYYELQAIPDAE